MLSLEQQEETSWLVTAKVGMLVSCDCCNRLPWISENIFSGYSVPEARGSRCSLACGSITSVSTSVVYLPPPLCLCFCVCVLQWFISLHLGIAWVTQNKIILSRSLVYTRVLLHKIIFTGPRNKKTDTVCVGECYFKVCCIFATAFVNN